VPSPPARMRALVADFMIESNSRACNQSFW
jgi:hypothetical protein